MDRSSGGRDCSDGVAMIRGDLCRRLDALERSVARRGAVGAERDARAIADIASDHGLLPVVRLAEGLEVALGAGGRGAAIGPWIERLRDAIDCDAIEARHADTWLASVMVRLAG